VDDRVDAAKQIGGRSLRAVHVGLEPLAVERADEVGETRRCAAELAPMVHEQDWQRRPRHENAPSEGVTILARVPLGVLHLSESDAGGGAAKAAWKLHEGLRSAGHVSRMLVGRRLTDDDDVRRLKRSTAWRALDSPFARLLPRLDVPDVFLPSSFAVAGDPWFRAADVVQLHNLHGSYFGYAALPLLTRRRPTIWWVQDKWPLTGHAAYTYDC
jgi:hypothetical protein